MIDFTGLKGHQLGSIKVETSSEAADFEDIVIKYIDSMRLLSKVSTTKQAIIIYKAFGYSNKEIAFYLGISERTVERFINSVRKFLKKDVGKSGSK